ncbi:DUF2975 domain-containing protein [Roseivirga misakiensis]|uniref:DUF2975 domain-containing protein n=1 Tax=Roseivirga misakiensis TaxID=1563681 RepID=A0A1E5T4U9_9BACT|nr:DUF2975 domain-containing protein [Roseivirga misakiensis]OEK06386.1 hypothetical protein BFP71_01535 [Roseivirga misakiensis]
MKISKVLLWIVNIAMIGSIVIFISFILVHEIYAPIEKSQKERNLEGALSMTEYHKLSNRFYDLDYFFIYRDGEVLIDAFMLSSDKIGKSFDYSNATKADFLEVKTAKGESFMPNVSETFSVPISAERIGFFNNLARLLIFASWLFFFLQLIWLRKLIKNTADGNFFEESNVGVFTKLGILYVALPIVLAIINGLVHNLIIPDDLSLPAGYQLVTKDTEFQFQYLFVGLMLLLISQAFKQGLRLRKEQELTI